MSLVLRMRPEPSDNSTPLPAGEPFPDTAENVRLPLYAGVVFPIPVDQVFTYAIPPPLRGRARPGMRAAATLRSRVTTGFVVEVSRQSPVAEVIPLIDLPDAEPVFDDAMLHLCRWVADYYCCSWGEALQTALPAALRRSAAMVYRVNESAAQTGRLTERQARVLALLLEKGPMTTAQLAAAAGGGALSNTLLALIRRGLLTPEIRIRDSDAAVLRQTWAVLIPDSLPDSKALVRLQRRAPRQAAVLLDLIQQAHEQAAAELYARHGTDLTALRALEKKGWIRLERRELFRTPKPVAGMPVSHRLTLNDEQNAACTALREALDRRAFRVFLLKGITGSGKTEVYLQVIEHALERGLGAIILVPEISLTPQTASRFYSRFPGQIAVLHSGLSNGERFDEWRRVRRDLVRIVVGARSAVFAPVRNLGIIVVDEEHDHSYKQADVPRYHARDVAVVRARQERAVCVLGSATPSLESMANARSGKYTLLELTRRATGAALPAVRIIDTREEMREIPGMLILSRELEDAVRDRLNRNEQVILLLNRRGFAPYVLCPKCGWVAECDHCQVSLTYHSADSSVKCHYCGIEKPVPQACGHCGFSPVLYMGLGTQRLEDYLARVFPGARIERMDADATAGRGGHARILSRFAAGQIDILVGTQMLAKGHDFPGVTLVGVINADSGLAVPDFRAAEDTFQLLCQVAGRAGRGDRAGEVYIQTARPTHFAIVHAARHDYDGFFQQEITRRQQAGFPPASRMARLLLEGEQEPAVRREALRLRNLAQRYIRDREIPVQVIGPSPAVIRKLKNRYRWGLGLLSAQPSALNRILRFLLQAADIPNPSAPADSSVTLRVDVDPQDSL